MLKESGASCPYVLSSLKFQAVRCTATAMIPATFSAWKQPNESLKTATMLKGSLQVPGPEQQVLTRRYTCKLSWPLKLGLAPTLGIDEFDDKCLLTDILEVPIDVSPTWR